MNQAEDPNRVSNKEPPPTTANCGLHTSTSPNWSVKKATHRNTERRPDGRWTDSLSVIVTSPDRIAKAASAADAKIESKASTDNIKKMNVDQLCHWLKPKLVDEDWNDVEQVIRKQRIKCKNFLNYIKAYWKTHGLSWRNCRFSLSDCSRISTRWSSN
jgi:hypothetical protein